MSTAKDAATPFELVGGAAAVRRLVDRFYDLMEREPQYAPLRAMHAPDLTPMRESLTGFLTGWLGGPRDWFDQRPGACMMSIHRPLSVTRQTSDQWVDAMRRAIVDVGVERELGERMAETLTRMAGGMARS